MTELAEQDYLTVKMAAKYAGISYSHWRAKVQPVFERFKKLLDESGDNGAQILAEVEALEAKYSK